MFKQLIILCLIFGALSGCASQTSGAGSSKETLLSDFGPAPEPNNETWLNTDQPLRLENLRGKVVLLEMWTFG